MKLKNFRLKNHVAPVLHDGMEFKWIVKIFKEEISISKFNRLNVQNIIFLRIGKERFGWNIDAFICKLLDTLCSIFRIKYYVLSARIRSSNFYSKNVTRANDAIFIKFQIKLFCEKAGETKKVWKLEIIICSLIFLDGFSISIANNLLTFSNLI